MDWDVFLMFHVYILDFFPHPVTVINEGLSGFPTRNGITLVVTVTGCGAIDIMYIKFLSPKAPVIGCHVG